MGIIRKIFGHETPEPPSRRLAAGTSRGSRGPIRPVAAASSRSRLTSKMLLVLVSLGFFCHPGQGATTREYAIKAAFLFHLAQFVEWPEEGVPPPGDPFCIGVLQPNPFSHLLEEIVRDATVKDWPVVVTYFGPADPAADCQVIFVPRAPAATVQRVIDRFEGEPVLLVGEDLAFLSRGGMVSLVREGDRVTIVMNLTTLRQANLQASSRLLRLATIVDEPAAP